MQHLYDVNWMYISQHDIQIENRLFSTELDFQLYLYRYFIISIDISLCLLGHLLILLSFYIPSKKKKKKLNLSRDHIQY